VRGPQYQVVRPDGKLAVLANDGSTNLVSLDSGSIVRVLPGCRSLPCFSPDGSRLYIAEPPFGIQIWEIAK